MRSVQRETWNGGNKHWQPQYRWPEIWGWSRCHTQDCEDKYMRKLLNTLYITSSEYYLSLDGENVIISQSKKEIGRLPLHNL